jgi:hypothetical protein
MANDNPSIVDDSSGNNYGGINMGGSMAQAQMEYLQNLQQLAMKAPPKPLSNDQYFPGGTGSPQIGAVSTQTFGSTPIFAPSNILPFAVMDEIKATKAAEEAKYYAGLKNYLNKPLIDAKLKLANPVAQPAFANKIQQVVDGMLQIATNRAGGSHMNGYLLLQQDPEFRKFLGGVSEYKDMYDSVYKDAADIVDKAGKSDEFYVSEDQFASANKFLKTQEIFAEDADMSFNDLVKSATEFKTKTSLFKMADAATANIKEDIVTEEMKKFDEGGYWRLETTTVTGKEDQADEIYKGVYAANERWLEGDPKAQKILKDEIEGNVKFAKVTANQIVRKNIARTKTVVGKLGVAVDEEGNVETKSQFDTLSNTTMTDVINYPAGTKPIYTPSQTPVYLRLANGTLIYGKLPQSYPMIPTYEGTITKDPEAGIGSGDVNGIAEGRYITGKVNLIESDITQRPDVRTATQQGKISDAQQIGTLNPSKTPSKVIIRDELTNSDQELYGDVTVLVNIESMKGLVEGGVLGLREAHKIIEQQYYPYTEKRNKSLNPNKIYGTTVRPVVIPQGADISYVDDSETVFYQYGDKVLSGKEIHNKVKGVPTSTGVSTTPVKPTGFDALPQNIRERMTDRKIEPVAWKIIDQGVKDDEVTFMITALVNENFPDVSVSDKALIYNYFISRWQNKPSNKSK